MSKKKLFGLIILIVGIIMVSALVGCKEDPEYTYTLINNSTYTVTVTCKHFDVQSFTMAPKTTTFRTSPEDNDVILRDLLFSPGNLVSGTISGYTISFTNK